MEYKAGDKITIKYRADFDTDNYKYEAMKDKGRYIYKTYKVTAVVSFECMLRAVGMSVFMTREIFLFENMLLGIVSVITAYFVSHPVLYYLYNISDMKLYGHRLLFNYTAFLSVSVTALILCVLLSLNILKSWKTKQIIEAIGKAD